MAQDRTVLLHSCCAPCSIFPLCKLTELGYSPTAYFYNPNIHPYTEYRRRLEAMKVLAFDTHIPLLIEDVYGLRSFVEATFGKDDRCRICYEMRIKRTAQVCKERGFGRFTTTLLYSKHQQHEKVIRVCQSAADEFGVEFLYLDFREGWKVGIQKSKEMGLYRQQYCGCIFSEEERYLAHLAQVKEG